MELIDRARTAYVKQVATAVKRPAETLRIGRSEMIRTLIYDGLRFRRILPQRDGEGILLTDPSRAEDEAREPR